MAKFDKTQFEKLYKAVLSLESAEECDKFFEDICTIQELETISQRLEVAGLIKDGKSYADISAETGASTATVCRVGKCIKYGSGGYDIVLNRIGR